MESMTVNPYGGQIYWNKYNYYGEIWQANQSGSEQSIYKNGMRTPTHLVYDLLGDNLLWFDYITTGGPDFRLRSGNTIIENNFVNPKALTVGYLVPTPVSPIITSMPITTAVTNEYYHYQPVFSGSQPLNWTLDAGTPTGVTVHPTLGTVEWIPSAAGSYTIHLRVTNTGGTYLQSYPLQVNNPPPPEITSIPDMKGEVSQPYQYRAGASGAEPISWNIDGPAGMAIDADSGLVTWTPGITGTFPVTIEATNIGGTVVQTYTVLVSSRARRVRISMSARQPHKRR
jgi:hypothetical protein